jgi:long-chain fatty acid transport protein
MGAALNKAAKILFSVLLFSAASAHAGGYFLPDRGVRAFSRGGAFVVGCDDLSAMWYNPAQLAGMPGTRVHTDFALVHYSMRFQRYTVPEIGEAYGAVENDSMPTPDPSIAVSSDFGLKGFSFALGAYAPYAGWSNYPEGGAQRYSIVVSENLAFIVEAAAAWQPIEGLRFGAGVAFMTVSVSEVYTVSAFPGIFGAPEDRDLDGMLQFLAEDLFIPTAVAGIWLHPGAWVPFLRGLELGFSFVPGVSVAAEGKMLVRLPGHIYFDGVTVDPKEPPVGIYFDLPWTIRAGVLYRYEDFFDIELDFVWEGWSVMDKVEVNLKQPSYYRDIPTMGDYLLVTRPILRYYEDIWSLRLGGSYKPLDWLVLRAGGYWESGAPPDEYFSVATPDCDKIAFGFGAGVILGAWEIDLGYMHVFQLERDIPVDKSYAEQVNPSNPEDATPVGGGRYQSSYNVFGLSLLVRLDKLW